MNKNHTPKKKKSRHKKHKKLRTSGFVMNHIQINEKVQQDFGLWGMGLENRREITNPLIISEMFS